MREYAQGNASSCVVMGTWGTAMPPRHALCPPALPGTLGHPGNAAVLAGCPCPWWWPGDARMDGPSKVVPLLQPGGRKAKAALVEQNNIGCAVRSLRRWGRGKALQDLLWARTSAPFPFFPSFLCMVEKSIFQVMQDWGSGL